MPKDTGNTSFHCAQCNEPKPVNGSQPIFTQIEANGGRVNICSSCEATITQQTIAHIVKQSMA